MFLILYLQILTIPWPHFSLITLIILHIFLWFVVFAFTFLETLALDGMLWFYLLRMQGKIYFIQVDLALQFKRK
jgi:hypothetical protein